MKNTRNPTLAALAIAAVSSVILPQSSVRAELLDVFAFSFNNEGKVGGLDRPIQAANWTGIYSSSALPLVTGTAVFADLSEGVPGDTTPPPGSYKAGFLFVSGKAGQPAPQGFLVWSTNTNVVDVAQVPGVQNPQTDWYSDPVNYVTNLSSLTLADLRELKMRINPRNAATVRYHFAIKAGGNWYISQSYFQSTGTWTYVNIPDVQAANWLGGVVGTGSLNLDFVANPPTVLTIADIGGSTTVDTLGVYIDTDSYSGETDSWARVDYLILSAKVTVPIVVPEGVELSFSGPGGMDVDLSFASVVGLSYQLEKSSNSLSGWGPVGTAQPGNGGTLTLQDVGGKPTGSDKVFYRISVLNN